jgi:hypothetical protein
MFSFLDVTICMLSLWVFCILSFLLSFTLIIFRSFLFTFYNYSCLFYYYFPLLFLLQYPPLFCLLKRRLHLKYSRLWMTHPRPTWKRRIRLSFGAKGTSKYMKRKNPRDVSGSGGGGVGSAKLTAYTYIFQNLILSLIGYSKRLQVVCRYLCILKYL